LSARQPSTAEQIRAHSPRTDAAHHMHAAGKIDGSRTFDTLTYTSAAVAAATHSMRPGCSGEHTTLTAPRKAKSTPQQQQQPAAATKNSFLPVLLLLPDVLIVLAGPNNWLLLLQQQHNTPPMWAQAGTVSTVAGTVSCRQNMPQCGAIRYRYSTRAQQWRDHNSLVSILLWQEPALCTMPAYGHLGSLVPACPYSTAASSTYVHALVHSPSLN
jgi:hypothetical protein